MKNIVSTYWHPKAAFFATFQLIFFACMWMSKTVHVLYFEQAHSLGIFGLSYSAMAIAGYFSVFVGHICDSIGFRRSLIVGCFLYAAGLALRANPDSVAIAIMSGLVAGAGASIAMTSLRLWMASLATEETMARMVGVKSSTMALGNGIGCMLAGSLPALVAISYRSLLLTSAVGVLSLGFLALFISDREERSTVSRSSKQLLQEMRSAFQKSRSLAITTSILGLTTGFYVSFVAPYLPLIMKEKGLDLFSIGLSTGSFALLRFVVDPWISRLVEVRKEKSLSIFLAAELGIAVVTAAFMIPVAKTAFIVLLLMRSLSLGFSAISEEVLWLRLYPKANLGMFFGLNQSAYFVGDFLGGLVNGSLYQRYGLNSCVEIVLVVMAVNSLLFVALLQRNRTRFARLSETQAA